MTEKKCNGYESMFLFLSGEDFNKHLEVCESCRLEHEKMNKVSSLIQEAKPFIKEQKKKNRVLKAACAIFIVCISTFSLPLFTLGSNVYTEMAIKHEVNSMTVDELGLPCDEYGFIYIY